MKKIIMAAAIACVAVYAQASTVKWGLSTALDTTTFAEGTAYLVCVDALTKPSLTDDAAAQAWYTANSGNLATTAFRTATVADGLVSETEDIAEAIGRKNYYLVVVNEGKTAMAISSTTKALNITTASLNATSVWTANQMTSYTLSAIPEPTSGLLMLVGLGALALRRKRA